MDPQNKANIDNRSNQLNSNNPAYQSSRGNDAYSSFGLRNGTSCGDDDGDCWGPFTANNENDGDD